MPTSAERLGAVFNDVCLTGASAQDYTETGEPLREAARQWVDAHVRVVGCGTDGDAEIRLAGRELGLSPAFVDAVHSDHEGASKQLPRLLPGLPLMHERMFSPRLKDVGAAAVLGGKPAFCPFTGSLAMVRDSIDTHTFLLRSGGRACVILPDERIGHAAGDRCWYFPERSVIVSAARGFDGREALKRTARRVVGQRDRVMAYLSDPARPIMLGEEQNRHIGHYVWNVASGWAPLFSAVPASAIDTLASLPNDHPFGGVAALFPHEATQVKEVVRPASDEALFDLMLDRRALSLTVQHVYVTAETADRIAAWSRLNCPAAFLARLRAFREDAMPLVMLTIRTGNRAWTEQAEGYARLVNELARHHPRLGIVIDGLNAAVTREGTHGQMSLQEEQAVAGAIIEACPGVAFLNSLGCLPQESIMLAVAIDAFVAPVGAGLAKTRWVANKPGVAFSNETFMRDGHYDGHLYSFFREGGVPMDYVGRSDVADDRQSLPYDETRANFSMDWRAPYERLQGILAAL